MKDDGADDDKITAFKQGIMKYAEKKIAPKLNDFEPYTGESFADDAMYITPLVLWKLHDIG